MFILENLSLFNVVTVLVVLLLTLYVYFYYVATWHLPPSVRGYPFLGFLPWLRGRRPEEMILELKKRQREDVFTMYMGMTPVVVLASFDAIKEALKQNAEVFSARPWIFTAQQNTGGGKGVVMHQYGNSWKDMRKFTLQILRDFGVGKTSLEEKIVEEIEAVTAEVSRIGRNRQPIFPQRLLMNAVSNIICSISFGSRYDYNDQQFQHILELIKRFFKDIGAGLIIDVYPWLRFIPILGGYFLNTDAIVASDQVHDFIRKRVDEHRDSFDVNNIRDFIDLYLKAEKEGSISKHIDEGEVLQVMWDLFNAGTETTSTTLSWTLLYLCHHQDMQERIYQEMDKVLGSSGRARMKDKSQLPYTNAFLLEVQRHASIAPIAVAHATSKDTTFRGYHIPKATMIFPVTWCAHRDSKYFPDPDTFNPDRWFNEAGELINNEAFIPFSIGPRFCLGEQLAKMEIFLFFTGLVQTFKFTGYGKLPSYDEASAGGPRGPLPYEVTVEKRF